MPRYTFRARSDDDFLLAVGLITALRTQVTVEFIRCTGENPELIHPYKSIEIDEPSFIQISHVLWAHALVYAIRKNNSREPWNPQHLLRSVMTVAHTHYSHADVEILPQRIIDLTEYDQATIKIFLSDAKSLGHILRLALPMLQTLIDAIEAWNRFSKKSIHDVYKEYNLLCRFLAKKSQCTRALLSLILRQAATDTYDDIYDLVAAASDQPIESDDIPFLLEQIDSVADKMTFDFAYRWHLDTSSWYTRPDQP